MQPMNLTLNPSDIRPGASTASLVAAAVRRAIVQGELRGGQSLRQEEIAVRLGVSKIPVREALLSLQAEGLVEFQTGRGAAVSQLSASEADEIYVMRIALEPVALRTAMPNLTETDFIQAESALKRIAQEHDPTQWGALNWAFHTTLYKPANMPRLLSTLKMWQTNVARYFFVYQALAYREKSNAEHWSILDACRQRDTERACAELAIHLRLAADELVRYLSTE